MALVAYLVLGWTFLILVSRYFSLVGLRDRILLLLLPLVESGDALVRGRILAPVDLAWTREPLASMSKHYGVHVVSPEILYDLWCQIIPWRQAIRAALAAGEWPLWNPFVLGGEPLLAAFQPGVFHPVQLLSLLLPLPQAVTFISAATLLIGAASSYVLSRSLGVGSGASLFAGAAWSYGAFQLFWLGWPVALSASAVPLLVAAAQAAAVQPWRRAIPILATVWPLVLLGGNPEVALVGGLLAGAAFLASWLGPGRRRPICLVSASAGTLIGLALCAVQLLPFLEALPQTAEHETRSARAGEYRYSPRSEVWRGLLAENVVPFAIGLDMPEAAPRNSPPAARANSWIGGVGLASALWAIVAARSRWRLFYALFGLAGVATAAFLPGIHGLVGYLPVVSLIRPRFFSLWSSLALVMLAALGLDRVRTGMGRRSFQFTLLAVGAASAAIVHAHRPLLSGLGVSPSILLTQWLAILLPMVAVALTLSFRRALPMVALVAFVGVLAERQVEAGHLYSPVPAEQFYPRVPPLDRIGTGKAPFRVVGIDGVLPANTATMWGLEDVRGYDPMAFSRYVDLLPLLVRRSPHSPGNVREPGPFLDFLNVRYALAPKGAGKIPGWRRRAAAGRTVVLENRGVLPRAFAPAAVRFGGSARERLADLKRRRDFRALAWLEAVGAEPASGRSTPNGPCRVRLLEAGFRYRIESNCTDEAWIVTSIPGWRGWRAVSAGHELPLAIANHAFVAFRVSSGPTFTELQYLPRAFVLGAGISVCALVFLALLVLAKRNSRNGEPGQSRDDDDGLSSGTSASGQPRTSLVCTGGRPS